MTNIKNTEQMTEVSSNEVKIASRKEILEELMNKGYLSFNKSYTADLFMNEYKDKGYVLMKSPTGEYRVYSSNDDIVGLNSFISDYELAYMCGLVDVFSDYKPLSFVFNANKNETFSYTLLGRNPIDKNETVLTRGEVNYSTEFQIKALPSLLIELRKFNNTLLVIEDGEEFNVDTAPDKDRSYVIFKELSYEQKKVIYDIKNFANRFVDSTKEKSCNDLSAIYTWEKQSLGIGSSNEADKKNAEDILKSYAKYANELNCPFYVSIVKNDDGTCNFKIEYFDEETDELSTVVEKNINFYGEFRTKVLPLLHADLAVNGGVGEVAFLGNNLTKPIDYKKFGSSSVLFFVGFSKLEMEYIQDGFKNIKYKPTPRPKVKPKKKNKPEPEQKPEPKVEEMPTKEVISDSDEFTQEEEVSENEVSKDELIKDDIKQIEPIKNVKQDDIVKAEEDKEDSTKTERTNDESLDYWLPKNEFSELGAEPVTSANDEYNKMIIDKISKFGYLKLSSNEFIEFAKKSHYIDWDTNLVGDNVFVYPSAKLLNQYDKNINATIFTTIRNVIQENDNKISVFVNRLSDDTCMVDINCFDSKTNSIVNLSSVRVMFAGDFLKNILPFLSNSLPILGPVVYKEFNVIDFGDELPTDMFKDKNVVMFRGFTPEMSQQLHSVIEFGDIPHFGLN